MKPRNSKTKERREGARSQVNREEAVEEGTFGPGAAQCKMLAFKDLLESEVGP